MSARKRDGIFGAAALVMAVCCAVLPAAVGAGIGGLVSGTTGIVLAVVTGVAAAGAVTVFMQRRGKRVC